MAAFKTRKTRLSRFQQDSQTYAWSDVEREAYKQGQDEGREWKDIVRQVLVGKRAEETRFHVRYFEITSGGYSSLEKHGHAHVVIAVRGQGRAVLGDQAQNMQPLDTVYVAPWTPYQFLAVGDGPFGFFVLLTQIETARSQSHRMNMIRRLLRGRLPANNLLPPASLITD